MYTAYCKASLLCASMNTELLWFCMYVLKWLTEAILNELSTKHNIFCYEESTL